ATGPLTSESLSKEISRLTQSEYLYFYDSIAPIVEAGSINMNIAFRASRYGKGSADYLNCPLNKEEYERLVRELVNSEKVPIKEFDQPKFFEACLPVEVMAERGSKALAFGPMKPVGLRDPRTGKRPYAVVQLRQDDLHANLYNMVGFQTRMKYPEQKRVFRLIPGLENAEFVRLGSMHRNTFINSPQLLNDQLELKGHSGIFLAGQMIGVEGYVESAATGLYAGLSLIQLLQGKKLVPPSPQTSLGALIRHITEASPKGFQPMNVNFGIFDLPQELRRKDRRELLAQRSLEEIKAWNPKSKNSWITSKTKSNIPPIPLKTTVTT
ncbi:MAG: methylenetetrahydrofolate--tRNA-(uracil(54)-C(5))-methyltransferase (FADH(2)-oxidizing) TrmFO, partial [bacterium]|nr:methylenetetrahydrofolate--tRNA-(uracil(54)-C(5))-methyltransferase (FADH(2)-oxidizing) TrmFO [bacterium]